MFLLAQITLNESVSKRKRSSCGKGNWSQSAFRAGMYWSFLRPIHSCDMKMWPYEEYGLRTDFRLNTWNCCSELKFRAASKLVHFPLFHGGMVSAINLWSSRHWGWPSTFLLYFGVPELLIFLLPTYSSLLAPPCVLPWLRDQQKGPFLDLVKGNTHFQALAKKRT